MTSLSFNDNIDLSQYEYCGTMKIIIKEDIMARAGYLSIQADEMLKNIFDEFTQIKGITKSVALNQMIEAYMLATDEELYVELKKKALNVEYVKEILENKEDTTPMKNDFIIMKLGNTETLPEFLDLDGNGTINAYIRAIREHGETWFSTSALYWGIKQQRVKFYNAAIARGETVKILFVPGADDNEVRYSATIKEIYSSRDEKPCPGNANTIPVEFGPNETAKIWFKLTDLQAENNISVKNLKFRDDDSAVKPALTGSQFHFGYVYAV